MHHVGPLSMKKVWIVAIVGGSLLLLASITTSFFFGSKYALEHLSTKKVTPDELGQAMKTDHFFRTYRENTLLVTGTVSRVERKNDTLQIVFDGTSDFKVRCSLKPPPTLIKIGKQMSLVAEGARAVRLPKGVLLKDCALPN